MPIQQPSSASTAGASTEVADRWVQQLRRQAAGSGPGSGSGSGAGVVVGRFRPASSSTTSTNPRFSSTPSLLSLDNNNNNTNIGERAPISPSTTGTTSSKYPSSSSLHLPPPSPAQPGQQLHHHHQNHQHRHAAGARHSHQQLSSGGPSTSSSSRAHTSLPPPPPNRREPEPRIYPSDHPRYDAEFDRGVGASSGGVRERGAGPGRDAAARTLFNPDGPLPSSSSSPSHGHHHGRNGIKEDSAGGRRSTREGGGGGARRSKRDVVDPSDLGVGPSTSSSSRRRDKDSRESFDSLEDPSPNGRPASRNSRDSRSTRKRRGGHRDRDRDRDRDDDLAGGSATSLVNGAAGGSSSVNGGGRTDREGRESRSLYDPKKHPINFSSSSNNGNQRSSSSSTLPVTPTPTTPSIHSLASASSAQSSSDDPQPQRPGGVGGAQPQQEIPSFVAELRRTYRELAECENKLQEDHRSFLRDEEAGAGVGAAASAGGLRIQTGGGVTTLVGGMMAKDGQQTERKVRFDDKYWADLTLEHKKLADHHYSFLQMSFDPRHPASLHSLPSRYNIPTRLWQTSFHQLLERMRHSIPDPASTPNVLEHLIEFIQYAYGFYSQLFEDPTVSYFRPAWIEQLGDLARYRMAVAGLASKVQQQKNRASAASSLRETDLASLASSFEGGARKRVKPADAASIGVDAIGDWDVEEQDSWRVIARDWYGQGVNETPGTGRLQHHLALLSKGDELKGLFHYVKSLTAAHPYLSARESILPLFDDELQARRTAPDVTKTELFVHLHGMLFTKISLDDFDECLARFLERLREESALLDHVVGGDWQQLGQGAMAPFGDAEWFMIGVINIGSLLQYGAEDGILKKHSSKEPNAPSSARPSSSASANKTRATPQAIMLNSNRAGRSETPDEAAEDGEDGLGASPPLPPSDVVMQLAPDNDDPLVFRLAQRLTFSLLELALEHPYRLVAGEKIVNPYIVLLLTFVANIAQHPSALRHLERSIPWTKLAGLFNSIPSAVEVRLDVQSKLLGSPLPEDWCIRGMDWTGKHIFSRGYWKSKSSAKKDMLDEMAPPPIVGPPTATTGIVESEMDALKFSLEALDEFAEENGDGSGTAGALLASQRWRRVATLGIWLVRAVPGFDFDAMAPVKSRFAVSGPLESKLAAWKKEDEEVAEAEKLERERIWAKEAAAYEARFEELDEEEEDEEEDDDEDPNDSEAVKELKARRRELKAIVRQARQATRPAQPVAGLPKRKNGRRGRPSLITFPGYTVLVFDTNILLASLSLLVDVVEKESWTVVVPLAVITELDGLKKNATALGAAAHEAVTYLEGAIRQRSRYLKVQTSRGNYLKDLSIRSESIDFNNGTDSFSPDFARSMDDVILRAVAWQKDHFSSRLAIVNPRADRRSVPSDASTVVLVTFDRNLRLKARARGLDATDERGLSAMVKSGPSTEKG
ncbi:hypothetical protein T439DRAFT_316305 [Meredithblackwellia eburnea MCA 4105]